MNPAPVKDLITFRDFEKLDIRVGTITHISAVDNYDKLTPCLAVPEIPIPNGARAG